MALKDRVYDADMEAAQKSVGQRKACGNIGSYIGKVAVYFFMLLESKFTEDVEGDDLTAQQEAEMNARCRRPQEACMSYRY